MLRGCLFLLLVCARMVSVSVLNFFFLVCMWQRCDFPPFFVFFCAKVPCVEGALFSLVNMNCTAVLVDLKARN